jgi:hypothetical protein
MLIINHFRNYGVEDEPKSTRALQAAEKLAPAINSRGFVTGHDFSRAVTAK